MLRPISCYALLGILSMSSLAVSKQDERPHHHKENHKSWSKTKHHSQPIELGPRPFFLVDDMDEGLLKKRLERCAKRPVRRSAFSIGHRGAPLQFPEHTKESYEAAAKMGAGILECDVTFTQDKELVCRHSQCDLHTTTNILSTPLASKCSVPFQPAVIGEDGTVIQAATARCCTTDITLEEFKTLQGKMDAFNGLAQTPDEYQEGTAKWRTDLYASRGTLLTHKESIALFKQLRVQMTPELKSPSVAMPFEGFSQQDYAQKLVDEYVDMGVRPRHVWPQSFNIDDVQFWINTNPDFGRQAVYLDGRYDDPTFDHREPSTWSPTMNELVASGVQVIAPPTWMLVEVEDGNIVPSVYALSAKAAGLDIITWTLERSGPLASGGGWYYQTVNGSNTNPIDPQMGVINNDGDVYTLLDVLAQDIGVIGVFADWPATVTYYDNCINK
ncbi:glycerophosphodiester phosphodiesterase family protein [Aurantivibrio plasticivorans]